MNLKKLLSTLKFHIYDCRNSDNYVAFLRRHGVQIGDNTYFSNPRSSNIDITRPSLVSIGSDCYINRNFTVLTHDYVTHVLKNIYNHFINSSGKVRIGSNVAFGINVTILKGVTIGDNCFVGANSLVTKDIPSNSIAVGNPCRVVCSVEDYYNRRKIECIEEAFEYANSIRERFKREPCQSDFWEEFHLFVGGGDIEKYPLIPIKQQLGKAYQYYKDNHKAPYSSLEEFLTAAKNHEY